MREYERDRTEEREGRREEGERETQRTEKEWKKKEKEKRRKGKKRKKGRGRMVGHGLAGGGRRWTAARGRPPWGQPKPKPRGVQV